MATIYSAYGDESADDKGKSVFAAAAIFGRQDDWDALSKAWFERTHGVDFHAANCESDRGDFKQTSHAENLKLYRDLTEMLCGTKLIGHAIAISLKAHLEHFPGSLSHSPYLLCFAHVVMECAQLGQVSIPSGKVRFTFDRNLNNQGTAGHMYECFTQLEWARSHEYLEGAVEFAPHQGNAPIQAADLLAREAMKCLEREILGHVGKRLSMEALLRARRFRFAYLRDADFAALGRQADELSKTLKGATRKEYEEWRLGHKCQDTGIDRMRYMMSLQKSRLKPHTSA